MAQQTRKDPRAKVLSMTVRYKSATLDEFIEHHSHDVSRGGMFIKTPQPFPPGTLLKFEVRIAEDRKVMQGVGRVVWKRDGVASDVERPSGMGVKFIKLDDESRRLIDQLLTTRRDEGSAFDGESAGDVEGESQVGLGLNSMGVLELKQTEVSTSFFPKSEPADLPPPEDRTVMKQAAELLEEALREVGSDSAEAGREKGAASKPSTESVVRGVGASGRPLLVAPGADEEREEDTKPGIPSRSTSVDSASRLPKAKPPERSLEESANALVAQAKAAAASVDSGGNATTSDSVSRLPKPTPPSPRVSGAPKPPTPKPPTPKPPTPPASKAPDSDKKQAASSGSLKPAITPGVEPAKPSGGSGRGVYWLLAVAASVGVIYWVTRPQTVPAPAPDRVTVDQPSVPVEPAPVPTPAEVPPAVASAPEVVASASAAAPVESAPAPVESVPAAPAAPPPVVAAPQNTPRAVVAKPKPQAPAVSEAPASEAPAAEVKPAEAKPAEPKPAEPKPAEPKPAEAKPAEAKPAEPKPAEAAPAAPTEPKAKAPAPKKPKAADTDNPY